jgi:hypothetical protein
MMIYLLTLFLMNAQGAETCDSKYWHLNGQMDADALAYDRFVQALPADATAPLNEYIHKHGILFQLNSPTGTARGFDNFLSGESASGASVGLFLKYMRAVTLPANSFDTVYEVATPESTRAFHKWNVPFGAPAPAGVEGFELHYPELLAGICSEFSRTVFLAVSTEGIYRAAGRNDYPAWTPISEAKCSAQRTFFKRATTAACGEFKDLKSGDKRILVWDARVH